MSTRAYWALWLVIGGAIAFAWPYLVPRDDRFVDGLLRAAAWVTGYGAAYLILRLGRQRGWIR
jgi:hypothetical protein